MKKSVLFVCIHNSARSQMAETFLKQTCGESFEVESAGIGALMGLVFIYHRAEHLDHRHRWHYRLLHHFEPKP